MLPTQILLNNLLYDLSQSAVPTDSVDQEYIEKPKKWDVPFIRRFMIFLGPISSIFDFLTFFIMLFVFNATEPLFQTAWFLESLSTQTLVIFVIRTRRSPFYKSKPSKSLLVSSIAIVAFALILPFTPLGELFDFVTPPLAFFIVLAGLICTYLMLVEAVKKWFFKRYAYSLEQILIPPRKIGLYLSKTTRLIHNIVALMCLHVENEISIDSLIEDLTNILGYHLEAEQVLHNLNHLRRAGLITINWRERTIKREKAMKDYVMKSVAGEFWPRISEDWHKVSEVLQAKYGKLNQEFLEILNRQIHSQT
jgi:hypothetical protein